MHGCRMMQKIGLMLIAALVAAPVAVAQAAQSPTAPKLTRAEDAFVCGSETIRQERLQQIPDRLLHAISLVEFGRWDNDRRASFAWPWTVTAEGEGRFLPSKAEAIAEVTRLKAKGVANIDVGCMQVNLLAHPNAFASLDEAFDPAANVAYGARFLTELRAGTSDWETAAAYYHSQTPALAAAYKAKLVAAWKDARTHIDDRLFTATSGLDVVPPIGMVLPTPAQDQTQIRLSVLEAAKAAEAATEAEKAAALARTQAERAEAKRIADTYRNARLAEYRSHKLQMVDAHG